MRLTQFFLRHPVIACVANAMLFVIGVLCFYTLSVREYPEVHLPQVTVRASFPNASAELVETAVTNPLEDQLAGIQGLETIESDSRQGSSSITLRFREGVSLDQSMMSIREAVTLVRAQLPVEVRDPMVERQIASDEMPFMIIALESNTMGFGELTHFANLNYKNAFRSVKGVASIQIWGQPFTYKIILDPKKLYAFGVNVDEIYAALKQARLNLPVGRFQNEIPVTLNSELKKLSDYENLVIRSAVFSGDRQTQPAISLKQIAEVVQTTDDQKFRVRINGKPGLAIAITKTNDANPLQVSNDVHAMLDETITHLPPGLQLKLISDQADFVRSSIKNIRSSIFEAIFFVLIIIWIFLGNVRSTLVPLVTIPISMVGAFIFLKVFSYSINIITLMAMVLAVGLVVDDAIVILENIQRHLEKGETPFVAAKKGAREIGFAIVAMTLTLTSVYAPLAFISGTIGQLFTEFAVALAGSVLLSGVVALTLSPLMCAAILEKKEPSASSLHGWINARLQNAMQQYRAFLEKWLSYRKTHVFIILILFLAVPFFYRIIPHEMAPKEDRGLIGIYVPAVSGKNIDDMEKQINQVDRILTDLPEVANRLMFTGESAGSMWLPLKSQSKRRNSADQLVEIIRARIAKIPSLEAYSWSWESALPGVEESSDGSQLSTVVSSTDDYRTLFNYMEKARLRLSEESVFRDVRHTLRLDSFTYQIRLDYNALSRLNLTANQIARTIEVFFSGDQSLEFAQDGILYTLTLTGQHYPWSLEELYVTNSYGKRISLAAVAELQAHAGAEKLHHYNQMRALEMRSGFTGLSLQQAMVKMQETLQEALPTSYKITWSGAAKLYQDSNFQMLFLFFLAIVFIFSILAMQFENFIDPFIILMTVPFACTGALLFVWLSGSSLNIYTQIGLITLIGLISKHGILIVEFANQLRRQQGLTLQEAMVQAAVQRLRPILMTTAAMIFGAIPLVLSRDAGYEARFAIGLVLIGGLSLGTLFTLLILPVFYLFIKQKRTSLE